MKKTRDLSQEQRNRLYCWLLKSVDWNAFFNPQYAEPLQIDSCVSKHLWQTELRWKCIFKGEKGVSIHSSLVVRTMQAYNTGLSTRESACENDESFCCCCFFLHEILSTFVSIASSSLPCNFTGSTTFCS